ncbi:hypothetical protein [Dysgonomonas reticulitermitis]
MEIDLKIFHLNKDKAIGIPAVTFIIIYFSLFAFLLHKTATTKEKLAAAYNKYQVTEF